MAQEKTLGFYEDPLNARKRFNLRTPINIGIVLAVFIALAFLFAFTPCAWLLDFALIAILFYAFFYFLDKRTIGMTCSKCEKHIATNTPWVCGYKECTNINVDEYPFVNRCEHCGAEPKAYKCHHCQELIFLSPDKLEKNFARCLNIQGDPRPLDDAVMTSKARQEQKLSKEHALAMAELDEKLRKIQEKNEGPKIKTPQQQVAETFERIYSQSMGPREYARKKKAEIAELYKNDPVSLAHANEAIEDALTKLT